MADVKISGLPASTVPLAGTEVLPIVQSSTTKKVSIANVTAGRAVSALSFAPTGSALPVNGVFLPNTNAVGIATDSEERLRVFATGGVSIGNTTDPGATNLAVAGSASAASFIPTSATIPTNGLFLPAANTIGFATNSTEDARLDVNGNLMIGCTTTAGTAPNNNNNSVTAGAFRSFIGSVSATSGTAYTMASYPTNIGTNITFIVSVAIASGAPTVYSAVSLISIDTAAIRVTSLQTAALMTITVSGTDVQATQASGGTQTISYTFTRIS